MSKSDIFDDFASSLQAEDVFEYCPSHEEMDRIQQEIYENDNADDHEHTVTRFMMESWRVVVDTDDLPF